MEHIGKQIGNYTITRLIGEGGMASVYEGEHEALGTKAAIKILNPILSANKQIRERFKNEARIMASLDHPNITRVLDFKESETYLAITMEYLAGEDLSNRIKNKGKLPEEEIILIFEQILTAFQYAHGMGIVHRDIKPSNIFILPNGTVKILDFGIAKLFGQGNEMTQTGTQLGTPIYMSPEQVKADKSIDHRSDIYSLGLTMYYALEGKPPYDVNTSSQFDIFNKIVFEPLPEVKNSSFLVDLIRKACEKDRAKRFQSCEEWQQALKPQNTNKPTISAHHLEEVKIGNQIWMTKNLNVDKFRNGDPILEAKTDEEWQKAGENKQPAWCYYHNDLKNGEQYGKLYNWFAVNDPRGIAPEGYHVPKDDEWTALSDYLGGIEVAGTKMKSASGWKQNGNGTNLSGLLFFPGGYRNSLGSFHLLGEGGYWWSATEDSIYDAYVRSLYQKENDLYKNSEGKEGGLSVRCLRD